MTARKIDRLRYVRWIWAPIEVPLWWYLCVGYIIAADIWESDLTQAFLRGLTGG